jgi:ribosomal protein S24E
LDVKIVKDVRNELFGRREIDFEVVHTDSGTPDRFSVRKALASKAGSKLENVYVLSIMNDTGTDKSLGRADVYENRQFAEKTLPRYLLIRNMPPEERAKVQKVEKEKPEEKKPEAKKAVEKKPEEKKVEEKKPEEKKEEKKPSEKTQKEARKA